MKLKGFIITGLLLIIAGFIVCIAGYANEGLDMGGLGFTPTVNNYEYNVEEIDTIDFSSDVDELEIRPTSNSQIQVITKSVKGFYYDVNVTGNKLIIEQNSDVSFHRGNCEVIIEIPSTALINYDIDLDVGTIEIENIKAGSINVSLDTGDVNVSGVDFTSLNVELDIGNIELDLIGKEADYTLNGKGTGTKVIITSIDIGDLEVDYNEGRD